LNIGSAGSPTCARPTFPPNGTRPGLLSLSDPGHLLRQALARTPRSIPGLAFSLDIEGWTRCARGGSRATAGSRWSINCGGNRGSGCSVAAEFHRVIDSPSRMFRESHCARMGLAATPGDPRTTVQSVQRTRFRGLRGRACPQGRRSPAAGHLPCRQAGAPRQAPKQDFPPKRMHHPQRQTFDRQPYR
jgi:hypothetical protein